MRGLVIGTAGHVDHGKTTLVRELTGIDTDRLPEERARGISIELGFAWIDRPGGRVAFVDVPGHERFVRQMIAGAAGVDAIMLIVAADEGVMPQSREHLAICRLLGVQIGAVVVTKVDRVETEWLALIVDDVHDLVRGTFLEGAPIVPFAAGDAVARERVLGVVDALQVEASRATSDPRDDRPAVLPFDRAFVAPGFGTIVTGTLQSGTLRVEDEVVLHPGSIAARIRTLEVHGARVDAVTAGHRVAVNVPQVSTSDMRAGVLVHLDGPSPTAMIDATFTPAPGLPEAVPDGTKGLVHLGTERVEATLALLGPPSESGFPAQLRLARPLAFLPGAPYVLRGFRAWPGRPELGLTLGGGRALAPSARRHRRGAASAGLVDALARSVRQGTVVALDVRVAARRRAMSAWIGARGEAGVEVSALHGALPWARRALDEAVAAALAHGDIERPRPEVVVATSALAGLEQAIVQTLASLHATEPRRPGLAEPEIASRVRPRAHPGLVSRVIARLIDRGILERIRPSDGGAALVALKGHRPPAATDPAALDQVVRTFEVAAFAPPSPRELVGPDGVPAAPIIDALVQAGRLVRVAPDLVFAASTLMELEHRVRRWFESQPWLEAQDLKGLIQSSRKYSIPLGEWLDRARVTVRVGDRRRLRG